jgi:dTDP-4-dehydrorhamnose reductase
VLEDIGSAKPLLQAFQSRPPTHIIHCAALSNPLRCEEDPSDAHQSNVVYTKMLAEFARYIHAHMTLVSTDLVFDGAVAAAGGFDESHSPQPVSVYASSKVAAERATFEATDLNAVVRLSLLYGFSLSASRGVLGWMEDSWSRGDTLPLFVDEFRTPIHVADAAYALLQVSAQSRSGVWHCGGPARLSRVEFGRIVADALGYDSSRIVPCLRSDVATRPLRPEDVSLNSSRLWRALDFTPHTAERALRDAYDPRKSA